MRWLKRLLLAVVFLVVFAGVCGFIAWRMFHGVPDWYSRKKSTPQEMAAAYARADKQIQRLLHDAQEAQHRQALLATRPAGPGDDDEPIQVSFTEEELNSYFRRWDQSMGWSEQYDRYLSDPQIVIQDGRLILAANVKEVGTVVSIGFDPVLEQGKLLMPVSQVLAGRLPLPQSFWRRYEQRTERALIEHLPEWQQGAEIATDGSANADAVAAGMGELLVDLMNNRPADPVLFLPYDLQHMKRGLPVRLTDLQISNQSLTLTFRPIPPDERHALVGRIRKPILEQTALPAEQ